MIQKTVTEIPIRELRIGLNLQGINGVQGVITDIDKGHVSVHISILWHDLEKTRSYELSQLSRVLVLNPPKGDIAS